MSLGDEVGIFYDVPDEEYHGLKIPSNSSVRKFAELPALYELEYLKAEEDESMTQAFQMGKVFEVLVLEPQKAVQICTFSTKTYDSKEAVGCIGAQRIPIAAQDLPKVEQWAKCMLERYPFNPETKKQVTGIVDFPFGEKVVRVKIRMDEVDFENRIIYDYKLMREIDPEQFEKDAWDKGYDTQNALYCKAMDILAPGKPWKFVFRVQMKHPYGFDTRFTTKYWFNTESIEKAWSHVSMQLQIMASTTAYRGYKEGCLSTERFKWGRG